MKMSADYSQTLKGGDFANENCIICCQSATKKDQLQLLKQGLNTVLEYTKLVKNTDLHNKIKELHSRNIPIKIHRSCQKDVFNKKRKAAADKEEPTSSKIQCTARRSQSPTFEWKVSCLFCEQPCVEDNRHPERSRMNRYDDHHFY